MVGRIVVQMLSVCLFFLFIAGCHHVVKEDEWVEESLDKARKQSLMMARKIDNLRGQLPRSIDETDSLITSGSDWWCSGFFPGTLWLLYEDKHDPEIRKFAEKYTGRLHEEQYNEFTHDLGFMMYCSYGNAYRLTGEDSCRSVLINASTALTKRFNSKVGCIQSWEPWGELHFPVIIDNMMNLEMLMWAYKETGKKIFKDIAISHADKTMVNHFREDNSSYHVVDYFPETGDVAFKGTNQGYSDDSAWSRGQEWGLYGYVMMYRETLDSKYLQKAHQIARFILDHPRLPEDKIPYWDFDSPNIPDEFRDSSTAAVIASALLELCTYSDRELAEEYLSVAKKQLQVLSSDTYTAEFGTNGHFILKHGVGNMPAGSEVDAPLSYGDYYYVEALLRYKNYIKGYQGQN